MANVNVLDVIPYENTKWELKISSGGSVCDCEVANFTMEKKKGSFNDPFLKYADEGSATLICDYEFEKGQTISISFYKTNPVFKNQFPYDFKVVSRAKSYDDNISYSLTLVRDREAGMSANCNVTLTEFINYVSESSRVIKFAYDAENRTIPFYCALCALEEILNRKNIFVKIPPGFTDKDDFVISLVSGVNDFSTYTFESLYTYYSQMTGLNHLEESPINDLTTNYSLTVSNDEMLSGSLNTDYPDVSSGFYIQYNVKTVQFTESAYSDSPSSVLNWQWSDYSSITQTIDHTLYAYLDSSGNVAYSESALSSFERGFVIDFPLVVGTPKLTDAQNWSNFIAGMNQSGRLYEIKNLLGSLATFNLSQSSVSVPLAPEYFYYDFVKGGNIADSTPISLVKFVDYDFSTCPYAIKEGGEETRPFYYREIDETYYSDTVCANVTHTMPIFQYTITFDGGAKLELSSGDAWSGDTSSASSGTATVSTVTVGGSSVNFDNYATRLSNLENKVKEDELNSITTENIAEWINNNLFNGLTVKGAAIIDGTIEGAKLTESIFSNGKILGSIIEASTLVDIPYASMDSAFITNLTADTAFIEALDAGIIKAGAITTSNLSSEVAKIDSLSATDAIVTNLKTTFLDADSGFIGDLTSNSAYITNMNGKYIEVDYANMTDLTTDMLKTTYANLGTFLAKVGIVDQLKVNDDLTVTGQIKGISILADVIDAGTLSCDRLIIKGEGASGEDSIMYRLNNGSVVSETITKEMLENYLHGEHIIANTITAEQIDVANLFAQDITATGTITGVTVKGSTIEGTTIEGTSIYGGQLLMNNYYTGVFQVIVSDSDNSSVLSMTTKNSSGEDVCTTYLQGDGLNLNNYTYANEPYAGVNTNNIGIGSTKYSKTTSQPEGIWLRSASTSTTDKYEYKFTIVDSHSTPTSTNNYCDLLTVNSNSMVFSRRVYNSSELKITEYGVGNLYLNLSTTADVDAVTRLTLGNNQDITGTTPHSSGELMLYSSSTGYCKLAPTSTTGTYTNYLPASNGTLINSSNYSSYALPLSGGTLTGTLTAQAITPSADATYSLGSSSYRWNEIYGKGLIAGSGESHMYYGTYTDPLPNVACALKVSGSLASDTIYEGGTALSSKYLALSGGALTGNLSTSANMVASGSIVSQGLGYLGQFEAQYGNTNVIFRNDGGNFYVLLGTPSAWNTLRPLTIGLSTGVVTCGNGLTLQDGSYALGGNGEITSFTSHYFGWTNSSNAYLYINVGGSIYYTRGTFSDKRLKNSITDLDADTVKNMYMALNPISYKFNENSGFVDSGKQHFGLIAQDVMKVMEDNGIDYRDSDLVSSLTFDNEETVLKGFELGDTVYRMNYEELHAYHISFAQTLYREIEACKKKIDELQMQLANK